MRGTVEAERRWEEELMRVEPVIEELMEKARGRHNWDKSLGRDLLREINRLSRRDPLVIADILFKEYIDLIGSPQPPLAREREMAFAILAHPEQAIIKRLSSKPEGRRLLDVIGEKAFKVVESDSVKWPSGWAALFVGKLGTNSLYRASRDGYLLKAERALQVFRARAEEQGWKEDLMRGIPGLRGLSLFL